MKMLELDNIKTNLEVLVIFRERSFLNQILLLIRKEKGFTQSELANIMNQNRVGKTERKVTKQLIYKFENDASHRFSKEQIQEIAQALELDNSSQRWALKQIYENAGFVFNRALSIGRGDTMITDDEIEQEADAIQKSTLKFSQLLAQGNGEEAYRWAKKALLAYDIGTQELKSKHHYEKLLGNIGTSLLIIGQNESYSMERRKEALIQSIESFEKVLKIASENPFFNAQLGHAYFTWANTFSVNAMQDSNWERARNAFKMALSKFNPASDMDTKMLQETCFYLGYTYTMLGQFNEAHAIVNVSLFLAGNLSALGLYLKACILAREEMISGANHQSEILDYLKKTALLDKSMKASIEYERLFEHLKKNKEFKRIVRRTKK